MSVRFCPSCDAEVEVNLGHCLLGHVVRLEPTNGSLSELRAEVDKAFNDAQLQVASVLMAAPVAPEPPAAVPVATAMGADPLPRSTVHRMIPPPPPPPPPPLTTTASVAAGLAATSAPRIGADPIAEFAPPPRMDWGPQKSKGLKRSLLRRNRAG
ncbi:MAG: hypothetical protein ACR2KQ_00850 [Actinomycetota bacterium]